LEGSVGKILLRKMRRSEISDYPGNALVYFGKKQLRERT